MTDPDSNSESEGLKISALDLMPNWVGELEDAEGSVWARSPTKESGPGKERGPRKERGQGRGRRPDQKRRHGDKPGGRGRGRDSREQRPRQGENKSRDDRPGGRRDGRRGRDDGRGKGRGRKGERDSRYDKGSRDSRREPRDEPLKGVAVEIIPNQAAAEALAKHVRATGRAYPMADVARILLAARDRYRVLFRKESVPDEGPSSELILCKADESLWLSQEEAMRHLMRDERALANFYRIEDVEVEPPKGNYTVIAVCGMSGETLGPPNHHEYQGKVARLHRERFSHVPLDRFKSRIEMRNDEESLEKWKALMSRRRQYVVVGEDEPAAAEPRPEASPQSGGAPSREDSAGDDSTPEETAPDASGGGEVATEAPPASAEAPPAAGPAPDQANEKGQELESTSEKVPEPDTPAAEGSPAAPAEGEAADVDTAPDAESAPDAGTPNDESADSSTETAPAPQAAEEPADDGALRLQSIEEVGRHFKEHYADDAFETVAQASVDGSIPGRNLARPLLSALRAEVDKQRRFPLHLIQELCRFFEGNGLKIFKIGKKTLFVAVARPRGLDPEVTLTDRVKKIIDFVSEHQGANVKQLLEAIVPTAEPPKSTTKPAETEPKEKPAESSAEENQPEEPKAADETQPPVESEQQKQPAPRKLSEEEIAVLNDLRWLTHAGFVIEFSSGKLRLGRNPQSREKRSSADSSAKPEKPKKPEKQEPTDAAEKSSPGTDSPAEESSEPAASDTRVEVQPDNAPGAAERPESPPHEDPAGDSPPGD